MRRLLLIHAAIGAAILFAFQPTKAQEKTIAVYTPGPPCDCLKPVGADDPEVWYDEAQNQTRSAEGSAEYDEAMERVYIAALQLCHGEDGEFRGGFRWLGRVSPEGIIVKTYTTAKSPFGLCMNSKLSGTKTKLPPKWREPGYPVTFDWGRD